jgi:hypothetical protein
MLEPTMARCTEAFLQCGPEIEIQFDGFGVGIWSRDICLSFRHSISRHECRFSSVLSAFTKLDS